MRRARRVPLREVGRLVWDGGRMCLIIVRRRLI